MKNLGLFLCLFSLLLPIKSFSFDFSQNSCHQSEETLEEKTFQKFGKTSETILSYEDVFRKYYDLMIYKTETQNIHSKLSFRSFCDNYYTSNLKLNEYVELCSGGYKEFEDKNNYPNKLSALRSSSSKDENYIFKKIISLPTKPDGRANPEFDPDETPTEVIRREIKYASPSAYDKIEDGDIIIETHTSQFDMGHAAYIYDINKHAKGKLSGRSTYIQTIEAVTGGVQFGFLDDERMVKFGVVIVRPYENDSLAVDNSKKFIYKQLGKPYYLPLTQGSYQTSINAEHWYCSELIYAAYYSTGTYIAYPNKNDWVWPFHILWSTTNDFVSYNNTLELRYFGKTNDRFKVRIYNRTGNPRKVYYNSKKCYLEDAKKWLNLNDWQNNYVTIYNSFYADVYLSSNWFADTFAVSYVDENKRYITYANEINDETLRMAVYKNVINV